MARTLLLLVIQLAFATKSAEAVACVIARMNLDARTVASAKVIFRGELVDYEYVIGTFAVLRFKTIETFRGERRDEWTVIWANSTFETPKSQSEYVKYYGADVLVAIGNPGRISKSSPMLDKLAQSKFRELVERPWISQRGCSPPVMLKWTAEQSIRFLVRYGIILDRR